MAQAQAPVPAEVAVDVKEVTPIKDRVIAADSPPSPYVRKDSAVRIPRVEAVPVIDGVLDDAIWKNAALFGDFVQTQPGDNVAPKHPMEYMMAYDAKNLYIAFKVKQERSTVRATVSPG